MSDAATTEDPPDLLHLLSAASYRVIVAQLYAEVVPPNLTDPELIAERVTAAIAEIASMLPANIEEAKTALRVVSADAQASDAIRHARTLFNDPTPAMKCHAQASLMMRTANAARSLLMRIQTARRKRDANPGASNQDAWTEHCAAGFLTAARDGTQSAAPPPPPPHRQTHPHQRPPPRTTPTSSPATTRPSSTPFSTPPAPPRSAPTVASHPPPATARPIHG